ncbi:MAG: PAS domain-containing hybrid sensor histidine kinase/response regulator [Abyssibacter sp.]|uniref:PAS domain-containing hybrid sensor histidine kinase/response regulator n=1 Tax=Abyssibacter sp. TaxID=2320200 RepID=UPI00321BABAD
MNGPLIGLSLAAYMALLFVVAWQGDRKASGEGPAQAVIQALSLAVYCTTWTFFGAVGTASLNGWLYLPIYLGPALVYLLGWKLIRRIAEISRGHHLTSIADFLAARFGHNAALGALATGLCLCATLPYIALQLRAVESTFQVLAPTTTAGGLETAFGIAAVMLVFSLMFGARHLSRGEKHPGVVRVIALESVLKLVALVAVAWFALTQVLEGPAGLWEELTDTSRGHVLSQLEMGAEFWTFTLLSACAIVLLPRQFHIAMVEHSTERGLRTARWLFPLYLLLLSLAVLPISVAGDNELAANGHDPDRYVLLLPLAAGQDGLALLAYLGGVAAATGMVIVSALAMSIMISNEWVLPWLLRSGQNVRTRRLDALILNIRRSVIGLVILGAYGFHLLATDTRSLAGLGLLAFVAVAQLAPAFLLGLLWRATSARGAIAGISVGFLIWGIWLALPTMAPSVVRAAPNGSVMGWGSVTVTTWLSLAANTVLLVTVSLFSRRSIVEQSQANRFCRREFMAAASQPVHRQARVQDILFLLDRFVGEVRTSLVVRQVEAATGQQLSPMGRASVELMQAAERQLAGAVGTTSARMVLDSALQDVELSIEEVATILDGTREDLRLSRRLLRATLDNVNHGVSVIDSDLRIAAWNQRYLDLFQYPPGLITVGRPLADIIRYNAERGLCGPGDPEAHVQKRLEHIRAGTAHRYERTRPDGTVIEMQGKQLPGGGYVTSFADITDHKRVQQELRAANENLEAIVQERTRALQLAKQAAERANRSKTQFLAAASHDLMQPISAARLFAASLLEQASGAQVRVAAQRIASALDGAEAVLSDLSEINRLDARRVPVRHETVDLQAELGALVEECRPIARARGIELRDHIAPVHVRTDRLHLRRIVQNYLSNALRYTSHGAVLIGTRRVAGGLRVAVYDTGPGIPPERQEEIYLEFQRLPIEDAQAGQGLGLGLAIVQRMARLLGHPIGLRSEPGRGSCFWIDLPRASAVTRRAESAVTETPQRTELAGTQVLCLDNDPRVLEGLSVLLSGWGATTHCAGDPGQARTVLVEPPDLAIVDYRLDDGVLGHQVLQELRRLWGREVPAILITADRNHEVRKAAVEARMILLHKPVKPATLRGAIRQARALGGAAASANWQEPASGAGMD